MTVHNRRVHNGHYDVDSLGWLPGWSIRALTALAAAGALALATADGVGGAGLLLLAIAAVLTVALPSSPAALLLVGGLGAALVLADADPVRATVLALIPLVHLIHIGSALGAVIDVRARVHWRVFIAPARRFVLVQAIVYGALGLVLLLPVGRDSAVVEVAALLAVTALALLATTLLRPSNDDRVHDRAGDRRPGDRPAGDGDHTTGDTRHN